MRWPGDFRVQFGIFVLGLLLVYNLGYFLYALDREIIYTWINVINYLTVVQLNVVILLAAALAYVLSRFNVNERYYVPILLSLGALSTVPFFGLTQPETDFLYHYDAARHIQTRGLFEGLTSIGEIGYGKAPLLAVLHAIVFNVFGEGYLQAEMVQRSFYVLLPVLVFLLGRRLWSGQLGFHAGLLVLVTPSILQQNYLLLQDIPVTFFTVLTVYLALRAFEDIKLLPLVAAFAFATFMVKNNGILFLTVILFSLLILRLREKGMSKKRITIFASSLAFIVFLAVLVIYSMPSFRADFGSRVRHLVTGYTSHLLDFNAAIPVTSLPYQLGLAQVLLFFASLVFLWRVRDWKVAFLAVWVLIPLVVLWGTRIRYFMPFFPAFSLLIAYGIGHYGGRVSKAMVYSSVLTMLVLTMYAAPQIVNDFVFKNIMHAAEATNDLKVDTVGVYTKYSLPWMQEILIVSAVDYYSDKKIYYLGVPEYDTRVYGFKYTQPSYYRHIIDCPTPTFTRYWGNNSTDCLDKLISENYTLIANWSGGIYYYLDPYYTKLYVRKDGMGGPTDAIVYASNVDYGENVLYDFWENTRTEEYPQTYSFGPVKLASSFGVRPEDWLGERQLMIKPPDVGQMNSAYTVFVPEDSSLSFSISLRPDTWHPLKGDGVRFRVIVGGDVLLDRYIDPKNNPDDRRLFHYRLPLTKYWGANTSFVFQTMSGPNNSSIYDTAGFGDPRIVVS